MKKSLVLFLLCFLIAVGGMSYVYTMLLAEKDQVQITETNVYGNKSILEGVSIVRNTKYDKFIRWNTNYIVGTSSDTETDSCKTEYRFDEYGRFHEYFTFGKEAVLKSYSLGEKKDTNPLTEQDKKIIYENLEQNVLTLMREHPDTEFYLYFPPYSICYWDELNQNGEIERTIDAEQYAIELLLQQPNTKLYCFFTNFEMVCDLDNYADYLHYGEWINDDMLKWMHAGEYLLTKENFQAHMDSMRDFYMSYDYKSLHE